MIRRNIINATYLHHINVEEVCEETSGQLPAPKALRYRYVRIDVEVISVFEVDGTREEVDSERVPGRM